MSKLGSIPCKSFVKPIWSHTIASIYLFLSPNLWASQIGSTRDLQGVGTKYWIQVAHSFSVDPLQVLRENDLGNHSYDFTKDLQGVDTRFGSSLGPSCSFLVSPPASPSWNRFESHWYDFTKELQGVDTKFGSSLASKLFIFLVPTPCKSLVESIRDAHKLGDRNK